MAHQRWPPEKREEVLLAYVNNGGDSRKAAAATGVPRRTVSEWVQAAAEAGRFDEIRAAIREKQAERRAEANDAIADVALNVRGELVSTLSAMRKIVADESAREDLRVRASDTVGRLVAVLDRVTERDVLQASVDGEALTAEEVDAFRAWLADFRERRAKSDAQLLEDIGTASEAALATACAVLPMVARQERLESVEGGGVQSRGMFGAWARVLEAMPDDALRRELAEPRGRALARRLLTVLGAHEEAARERWIMGVENGLGPDAA